MILRLAVDNPNDKATHIEVDVSHCKYAKRVILSVDPIVHGEGFTTRRIDMLSKRKSRFAIIDMPRKLPKQVAIHCQRVKDAIINGAPDSYEAWPMIRAAAAEAGVTVGEVNCMNWEEVEA